MSLLTIGFLSAILWTDTPETIPTSIPTSINSPPARSAAVQAEYQRVLAEDDAAQAEVSRIAQTHQALKAKGEPGPQEDLNRHIDRRFKRVRKAYEAFLRHHPNDSKAHLDYGNFLNERQDEAGAQLQWEKALTLDPLDPVVYNNLAGRYSENGQVTKAFEFFTKAIELNPVEPLYYHDFADSLYVLRASAMKYYGISEEAVYGRVLMLFSNAARLDPKNFGFACDIAQTYYSIKPFRAEAALSAWTNAVKVAREENEREEVAVHLARVKMLAGRLGEARAQLSSVTNESCSILKSNLLQAIGARENTVP